MIDVSIGSGDLVVGRRSSVPIRFANVGPGACSNVVFRVRLPAGIVLMGGSDRVEIPLIHAGRTHTHEISIEAGRPGRFELTSANFSYRDELDRPVRVTDFRAVLVVRAAPPPAAPRPLTGRIDVAFEGGELDLGAWDVLRILATNRTDAALNDVIVTVDGPFLGDGRRSGVAVLGQGATARLSFSVNGTEAGRHVPVNVRTTYTYPDGTGGLRARTQEDRISVAVRPAPPSPAVASSSRTVLYLAANPRNMPPLRSDLEMRNVMERLQRSRLRDQYRLEPALAVRFNDISQAMLDHEPSVVHFSGHGARDGNLCIEDDNGNGDFITPEGLAGLFGQHRSTLKCVILNACFSHRLAEAVAAKIDYVIGMRYEIGEEAAIVFSEGFYIGLFNGRSVPEAFDRGRLHLLARPELAREESRPLIFGGR